MFRISIAQRLALLAAFVALVMTLAVSVLSYLQNRTVLITHELVDLADESNLRMHELREESRFLMREAREAAGAIPQPEPGMTHQAYLRSEAFRRSLVQSWERIRQRCDERGRRSPSSWLDRGVIRAIYGLAVDSEGGSEVVQKIIEGTDGVLDRSPDRLLASEALADLQRRYKELALQRRPTLSRQLVSDVRPLSTGELRQAFCIGFEMAGAAAQPLGLLVIVVDFTRMVENRARHSARHLYLVTDDSGRFLIHPDVAYLDGSIREDRDAKGRIRFAFKNVPWAKADGSDEPDEFSLLGESLRTGELPPGLTFWFVRRPYSRGTPFQNSEQRSALEADLEQLTLRGQGFRFSRQKPESREITLAAQDKEILREAQRIVEHHERNIGHRQAEDWEGPIFCRSFAAHLVPLRLGPDPLGVEESGDNPLYLIVIASLEEIAQDIFKSTRSVLWASLALCVGAGWLALIPAVFLTRPLKRINQAAQRLAEGAYDTDLPTKAPGEIGTLARTFRHMAEQIRQRDQELTDALARMQAVLRTAADGIITFNEQGIIEEWNQAAERIFGYRGDEIRGQRVQQLMDIPPELARYLGGSDGSSPSLQNVFGTPNLVHRGRRKDGATFWLELAFSEVPLKDRRLITGIFRDVTRRVEDEERIKQLNELLEARVRLRTAELEEAKSKLELALDAAQAANRAKDAFVRTISHELRTPLSAVKGFTELLLNPKATKLRENPIPTLQKIHSASEYLLSLINDLLDVARMTAGEPIQLNLAEFEVLPFCQAIVEMAQPLMKKNNNQLVVDFPAATADGSLLRMYADETRVRQILLNLLSNAAKFTENGQVTFQVRQNDDWVEFHIRDTGAGMTAEQMQGLFKPFYRIDNSTTRKQGGTGLGLSISKLLAERMGGTILVESQPGVGSEFTVRLPVRVADNRQAFSAPSAPRPVEAPRNRHTILVIDDDPLSREMLQSFLQREGFAVIPAAGGDEGIRLAREHRPAAITLDVLMPQMDGWSVLASLKSDRRTHDIPVIMLTVAEDRQRGFALGASDFLTKPIDWNRLSEVLHRYADTSGHILVVEDDPSQREHLVQSLRLAGWQVREASDGREALQAVMTDRPAVILLDLLMPNMNGFEFLEELRRIPNAEHVPVIVVTAKDLDEYDRARLRGWVAEVIGKQSLKEAELLQFIRKHLPMPLTASPEASHG
jgi:adenylate cyclase